MPAGTCGRFDLQQRVRHLQARQDQRIVGAPQAKAHQLQEVDADLCTRRQGRIDLEVLDRQHALRQAAVIAHGLRRGDAHVVAAHAVQARQGRIVRDGPVLEPRIPVVGNGECQRSGIGWQMAGPGHQGRDAHRQGEGVETRVLLPAVLVADRAVTHQERQRAANHVGDFSALERAALIERYREQHRKRTLIELHTGPVDPAPQPLVLVPVSVRILRGEQIPQRVARLARCADRQQRTGALDQIARPHQVITLALLARVAPGHAQ